MQKLPFFIVLASILFLKADPGLGQQVLTGDWEGYIDVQGQKLSIITHFEQNDTTLTGTIDIPQQMARDIKLQNISVFADDSVAFNFFCRNGNG